MVLPGREFDKRASRLKLELGLGNFRNIGFGALLLPAATGHPSSPNHPYRLSYIICSVSPVCRQACCPNIMTSANKGTVLVTGRTAQLHG
jgi:hypothetical protein